VIGSVYVPKAEKDQWANVANKIIRNSMGSRKKSERNVRRKSF